MRHRSCSTLHSLHCMYDLSQGTLTITIKDRDIRQRSTSPYFSSPSCPKCPNCSPYESTLPLCTLHSALHKNSFKLAAIPFKSLQVRNSNLTPRRGERHLSLPSLRLRRCPSPSDDPTPLTFYFPALKTFSSPLQLQVSSRRLPPHSSV